MGKPLSSEKYQNSADVFREDSKQEGLLFQRKTWTVAAQTFEVSDTCMLIPLLGISILPLVTNDRTGINLRIANTPTLQDGGLKTHSI